MTTKKKVGFICIISLMVAFCILKFEPWHSKHIYYVNLNAEAETVNGWPSDQAKNIWEEFNGDFYRIGLKYPHEHLAKETPKTYTLTLYLNSKIKENFNFKINSWKLFDSNGEPLEALVEHPYWVKKRGYIKENDILGHEFTEKGVSHEFYFYYDIPRNRGKQLKIAFEIELTKSDGTKVVVDKEIELKPAIFKVNDALEWFLYNVFPGP